MNSTLNNPVPTRRSCILVMLGLAALSVLPLRAIQFAKGDFKGTFDTTLSIGGLYRLSDPSPSLYSITNSAGGVLGQAYSGNSDDGDLNFPKGMSSQMLKASHDLELRYKDAGALVRGYYFYDGWVEDHYRGRTELDGNARDRVGRGAEWLDMYAFAKFDAAGMPCDIRFGRQVLSLGESTFIPNGINVINPVDLSKLRVPGAELKEALLPVNMFKLSMGVTKDITIEPFWLLEFRKNEIEPTGTYFSTNDFAARGGKKVMLGFGGLADSGTTGAILRDPDREGANFKQAGISVRWLATALNDTEFGFYYMKYSSRSPVVSARTPTRAISSAYIQATASSLAQQNLAPAMVSNGVPAATVSTVLPQLIGAALTDVPAASLPATLAPFAAFYPSAQSIAAGAKKLGLLDAAGTGRYFVEYPEDINMVGLSFNTNLGKTGISWAGEVSYKQDVPLQVDDVELLFCALSALNPTFGANNQLGNYLGQYGTEVSGYRRHNVATAQSTMTKVFGPMLGASSLTVLGEVGFVWANLPSRSVLRYDAPGTYTTGNTQTMINTGNGAYAATPEENFASDFSWGYQVLGRLEYANVFAGVNINPSIAFTHDVKGITPLPLGNFLEDRKSVTAGAEFVYKNSWSLDVRYVNFFGAGNYNLLGDRDYVSATIKYSF